MGDEHNAPNLALASSEVVFVATRCKEEPGQVINSKHALQSSATTTMSP